jgi:hypothetical protein
MRPIISDRITKTKDGFTAACICGSFNDFRNKSSALKMVYRGSCKSCKIDYRKKLVEIHGVYKRSDGKWCSNCHSCGAEQAYTRKSHAESSSRGKWKCKPCASKLKYFSENNPTGPNARTFNKFKKSAISRGLTWNLTQEEMYESFNNACSMTGLPISLYYSDQTASLDRIDNNKGYEPKNIQWVHKDINMMRGPLSIDRFIELCKLVTLNKK